MDPVTIEIAALGRPLHPGMLYDCRNDTFIPGLSPWDLNEIDKALHVREQPHTAFEYAESDEMSAKTKLMNISASLSVSFLAGLVQVGGSGSYLSDKSSSMRQCRATMKFKETTVFKQLTMEQLADVAHPEVFEQRIATHVVTGVLYGTEAYMVFDQMATNQKDKEEISASLSLSIKKIPGIDVSASGSVNLSSSGVHNVEKFSCTFHGDSSLNENPTNFEEAVLLVKKLPDLIGDGSKVVPLRVWLYPLIRLSPAAAKLMSDISGELASRAQVVMEQLDEAEMRSNDCLQRCESIKDTFIAEKLRKFQNILAIYAETLKESLKKILPAVRAGTESEEKLENVLDFHDGSSFQNKKIGKWLNDKESEIGVLESYIEYLSHLDVVKPGPELHSVKNDPKKPILYIFSFSSLKYEEPYLSNLDDCLNDDQFKKMETVSVARRLCFEEKGGWSWFKDNDVSFRMRKLLAVFQKLPVHEVIYKCISYVPQNSAHGACVFEYSNGHETSNNWGGNF